MTSLAIYSAGRNWVRLFTDEVIVADIVLVILPIFVVYAVSTYVRTKLTSLITCTLLIITYRQTDIHIYSH